MKMTDYREALGLGFDDVQKVEALCNLLCTTFSVLENYISSAKSRAFYERPTTDFTKYYREVCEVPLRCDYGELSGIRYSILNGQSISEIVFKYVAFTNTLDSCFTDFPDFQDAKRFLSQELPNHLDAIGIPYSKIKDDEGIFIIPKGAPELDNALVSAPLKWMEKYPDAQKSWIKALKDYSDQTDENASDIADKFRKALETFFQEFFGGGKSLENYKTEYGEFLKAHGVPAELSGNFQKLLESYTNYINSYAKHHDKTSQNVLEYIMYQTGNIIRLLITLKQREESHTK